MLGDHREVELGRDEARLEAGLGQRDPPGRGVGAPGVGDRSVPAWLASQPGDVEAAEVVREPLAFAPPRERDHHPVVRARQLLELGLGLLDPAGLNVRGLGPERERLVLVDARQSDPGPVRQLCVDRVRIDVEVVGILVVERGAHVLPVVVQRRGHVLLARDQDRGVGGRQLEERVEVLDREQLGDVGAVGLVLERGDLRELAMLGRELGGGRDLDQLGVAERALGEGREPAQRLDLVAEQVDPDGAVLGRREHVEDPAADRELAPVLDLVDPLVAGGDEIDERPRRGRASSPARSTNPCGRSAGSGTFSDSATALTTTTGACWSSAPSISASSAAIRSPTRCGGGARCDSYVTPRLG